MSYKDRIFERHDVYDVLLYKSEDLYFGDREFYAEHVIGDAETAESDSDLGVSWNYDKMNTVVYGIFDKGMIIQVVRKVKPGDPRTDAIYADRAVHELCLTQTNRETQEECLQDILAYYKKFDENMTKNLLKQASDRQKAEYLMKNLRFRDIKLGHMSKNEAMRKFKIKSPIPFSDGGLCPVFFNLYLETGNESYLELICNRNLSCLIIENEITKKLIEIGYLKF